MAGAGGVHHTPKVHTPDSITTQKTPDPFLKGTVEYGGHKYQVLSGFFGALYMLFRPTVMVHEGDKVAIIKRSELLEKLKEGCPESMKKRIDGISKVISKREVETLSKEAVKSKVLALKQKIETLCTGESDQLTSAEKTKFRKDALLLKSIFSELKKSDAISTFSFDQLRDLHFILKQTQLKTELLSTHTPDIDIAGDIREIITDSQALLKAIGDESNVSDARVDSIYFSGSATIKQITDQLKIEDLLLNLSQLKREAMVGLPDEKTTKRAGELAEIRRTMDRSGERIKKLFDKLLAFDKGEEILEKLISTKEDLTKEQMEYGNFAPLVGEELRIGGEALSGHLATFQKAKINPIIDKISSAIDNGEDFTLTAGEIARLSSSRGMDKVKSTFTDPTQYNLIRDKIGSSFPEFELSAKAKKELADSALAKIKGNESGALTPEEKEILFEKGASTPTFTELAKFHLRQHFKNNRQGYEALQEHFRPRPLPPFESLSAKR